MADSVPARRLLRGWMDFSEVGFLYEKNSALCDDRKQVVLVQSVWGPIIVFERGPHACGPSPCSKVIDSQIDTVRVEGRGKYVSSGPDMS